MPTVLERLPQGARVAVVRLRSLGDCVLSTPAIHILKQARPDLRVAVAVENVFRPVYEGNPDIDELLAPLARAVRKWRPWLCWNLHGGTVSLRITAFSGARLRAGYSHFRYRFLYNVRIPRAQEILGDERKVHTAEHAASAVFYFGAPRVEIPRARLFAPPAAPSKPYAVIHPIASAPSKTWSAAGFLAVAAHLERAHGMEPVFVAGGGEDVSKFTTRRCVVGAPLSKVKALIAGASLFVGNDSGPAHMAAAFGVPLVVIFGASDVDVWRPWRPAAAEVVRDSAGIGAVTEARVIEALERLKVRA
jgi:ADP-heptose:LPS heptosyltransferase